MDQQMMKISGSTNEILNALQQIEDISIQTNLFSLNASVEAACGGGTGDVEGFKVVAQEIRSIAHRFADAASSIREMTDRVRASVAEGVELVERTNEALVHINDAVAQNGLCTTRLSEVGSRQKTLSETKEREAAGISENAADNLQSAIKSADTPLSLVHSAEGTIRKISQFKRSDPDRKIAA